jgi:hypothetical protein
MEFPSGVFGDELLFFSPLVPVSYISGAKCSSSVAVRRSRATTANWTAAGMLSVYSLTQAPQRNGRDHVFAGPSVDETMGRIC